MKNVPFLASTITATAVTILFASSAQAFSFALNNYDSGTGAFSYSVTLAMDETLSIGDPLALTDLGGVTAIDSSNNGDLQFSLPSGFDSISANFLTSNAGIGAQTFNDVIILTSSNPLGTINYSGSSSAGAFSDTTFGPVTAVPFEPNANLGISALLGLIGLNYCRQRFKN